MDRDALTERVRRIMRIGTNDYPDANLELLLDEGIEVVSASWRWPFLVTSAQVTTVATQEAYVFSTLTPSAITDFNMPWMMYKNSDDTILTPISYQRRIRTWGDDPDTTADAEYFYIEEDKLGFGLIPVPSASTANKYTFVYYKTPTLLTTAGTSPEWTAAYHDILVDYVAAQLYEREEFYSQAEKAKARFDQKVLKMKRYYTVMSQPQPYPVIFGGNAPIAADYSLNLPSDQIWG